MKTHNYLADCLDMIEDGIIVVDREKIIQVYNKRAREIFGLDNVCGEGHPGGSIARGDIVVIADTSLGADDGGLQPEDLGIISLSPRAVNRGDAFIAVGRYQESYDKPYYVVGAGSNLQAPLALECCINKRDKVEAVIDDFNKNITINYNGRSFVLNYQIAIAHLLIIDGKSGAVKFYQSKGYTARGEDPRHILMGKEYLAKGPKSPMPSPVGQPISSIHPDNQGTYYLDQVLSGQSAAIEHKEHPINGIWVRSSAYPLYGEGSQVIGGVLVFRDINELKLLERQVQHTGFKYPAFQKIKGNSPGIMEAIKVAQRVSRSKSTVLLLGESGTGKGLFAKAIHNNSTRADKPFVTVNTAAIPINLLESELFGYETGAFTGAKKGGEIGKFRLAQGGTIFLDEVGEMDFYLQAKILHVLQDDSFFPVGSSKPVKIDVRIIAATNKNLEEEVKKGRFREDLYYRLNVVSITIPPLRHRQEDIRELMEYMLPLIKERVGRVDLQVLPEVYEAFLSYDWPGNIRELENVLERAVNMAEGRVVSLQCLPPYLVSKVEALPKGLPANINLRSYLKNVEKDAIIKALEECNYNKTKAMKRLGLGRTAFYQKIKNLKIPPENVRVSEHNVRK